VWDIGTDLFVAHELDEVVRDRTLQSFYLTPLVGVLDHMNCKWTL
jgi:hypothetical protein